VSDDLGHRLSAGEGKKVKKTGEFRSLDEKEKRKKAKNIGKLRRKVLQKKKKTGRSFLRGGGAKVDAVDVIPE